VNLRRLAALTTLAVAVLLAGAGAARADYGDDSRTAKGVTFGSPRASLGHCLRLLSEATGVTLTAAPALTTEPLVGYVPRRPLRETMQALEALYDGQWVTVPGSPVSYRLDPEPVRAKAAAAARAAAYKEYRKTVDEAAADAARRVKAHEPLPASQDQKWRMFPLLLWSHLTPAARDRVLNGETVTISIPQSQVAPIHELILGIASKAPAPVTGPALATYDLDDRTGHGIPSIRARATVIRENSVVGAIGSIEFVKQPGAPKPQDAPEGEPLLPAGIGEAGRFSGERDEVTVKLAEEAGVPILSRHRAQGGSSPQVVAGGRRPSDVMADLSNALDADFKSTARGYFLFRSRTEPIDRVGIPTPSVVEKYLALRPPLSQTVSFTALAALVPLSPLQLAVLQHCNVASEDATIAGQIFAVIRFYQSLKPEQQRALFSEQGLAAESLDHRQLHAFLDQKDKRGDLEVHDHLQQIKGLYFRFREERDKDDGTLVLQVLRDGSVITTSNQDLPRVSTEEVAAAVP
jgi:hypothetical protein